MRPQLQALIICPLLRPIPRRCFPGSPKRGTEKRRGEVTCGFSCWRRVGQADSSVPGRVFARGSPRRTSEMVGGGWPCMTALLLLPSPQGERGRLSPCSSPPTHTPATPQTVQRALGLLSPRPKPQVRTKRSGQRLRPHTTKTALRWEAETTVPVTAAAEASCLLRSTSRCFEPFWPSSRASKRRRYH